MSNETDNFEYVGLCLWDSCIGCPHEYDCPDSVKEEDDEWTDD